MQIKYKRIVCPSIPVCETGEHNPVSNSDFTGALDNSKTNNPKESRSIRKYGRKFEKMKNAHPEMTSPQIHKALEEKYNNRRWMWILDKNTNDKGGAHSAWYHAGDLYKESIGELVPAPPAKPIVLNAISASASASGATITFYRTYQVPAGASTFTTNLVSFSGTWTYNFDQGNNTSFINPFPVHLAGPLNVNVGAPPTPVNIPINSANGNFIVVSFTGPSVNGGSATNLQILALSGPLPPQPFLAHPHEVVVQDKINPHPDKLNRSTMKSLFNSRDPNNGRGAR